MPGDQIILETPTAGEPGITQASGAPVVDTVPPTAPETNPATPTAEIAKPPRREWPGILRYLQPGRLRKKPVDATPQTTTASTDATPAATPPAAVTPPTV